MVKEGKGKYHIIIAWYHLRELLSADSNLVCFLIWERVYEIRKREERRGGRSRGEGEEKERRAWRAER